MWGAFANQGQVCVSVERVYAHQSVHDELVAKIVAKVDKLRPGEDTGSMTWERQTEIVEERIATAVDGGRQGAHRRQAPRAKGLAFAPTVLTDCRQDMDVMRRRSSARSCRS